MNIAGNKTEETKIKGAFARGVSFHRPYSTSTLRRYSKSLEGSPEGIKINGETINNIRYADDTVILASSLEYLQTLLEKINATSVKYGLNLNTSKTKHMTISNNALPPMVFTLDRETIKRVERYTYLGLMVNSNWDQSVEVRSRIEKARTVFNKMKTFFVSRNLSLKLKIRMVRCYILPVLLYGFEAWTMIDLSRSKCGYIGEYCATHGSTNEEVLRRMDKTKEVTFTVKRRKIEYLGHIMRNNKYRRLTVGEDREGEEIRGCKTCASGLECHLWNYLDRQLRVKTAIIINKIVQD